MKEGLRDKYMGITPREMQNFDLRHKKVLKIFSKYEFDEILDIGCGDGNFSIFLQRVTNARRIYGIDVSERAVNLAREKGIEAFLVNIDEQPLPFQDDSIDAVFAGEIIEHTFDPDRLLDEVYRVLKPKGLFVVSTPNLASIYNVVALLLGFQPFPMCVSLRYDIGHLIKIKTQESIVLSADHIRVFTYRSLMKLLEIHRFRIISLMGSCAKIPYDSRFASAIKLMDRIVALFPSLSYRVIVACMK